MRNAFLLCLTCLLMPNLHGANPPRVIARMDESPIVVRLPNRTLGAWLVKASATDDDGVTHVLKAGPIDWKDLSERNP